jgi:hypothetical protein
MTDQELAKLENDEAAAYAEFHAQDEISKSLATKWVQLKQKLDREKLRREIMAEEIEKVKLS